MARKTKTDAEQTRQKLLEAAEMLFCAHGVSRTTLQDIATAAGVTRGAVYWHFQDKAALFNAMMESVVLPWEQAFAQASDPLPQPGALATSPMHRLLAALQAALHATVHDAHTRRVFAIAVHKVEYVDELQAVALRRQQGMGNVIQSIEKAIELTLAQTGHQLPMPVPVAALGLLVLLDGLINHWLLATDAFDLEEVGTRVRHQNAIFR